MDKVSFLNFLNVQSKMPDKKPLINRQNNYCPASQNLAKLSPENYRAYAMNRLSFGKLIEYPPGGCQVLVTADGSFGLFSLEEQAFSQYSGLALTDPRYVPVGNDLVMPFIEETLIVKDDDNQDMQIPLNKGMSENNTYKNKCEILRTPSEIIRSVDIYPVPVLNYEIGKYHLKKEYVMPHTYDKDTRQHNPAGTSGKLVIGYTNTGNKEITINLKPNFEYRNFHHVEGPDDKQEWNVDYKKDDNKTYFKTSRLDHNNENREPAQIIMAWSKNDEKGKQICDDTIYSNNEDYDIHSGSIYLLNDDVRGKENHAIRTYRPCKMSVTLKPGESFSLTVTAGDDGGNLKPYYIKEAVDTEKERLESLLSNSGLPETDNARALLRASDQLIAPRVLRLGTDDKGQEITECYTSIIAGIPWLKDWSRGTMISLPGILLVPKRYKEAKSVLSMWAKYMDHGQIPNTFDFEKYDKPQFGGMDGALYWFNALDEFNQAVEGAGKLGEYKDFIHDQYDALKNVVDCHIYGRHSYKTLTGGNDKEIYDEKAGILEEHQVEGNKTLAGILEKDEDKGRKHVGPNWLTEQVGMEPDGLIAADEDHLTWMDGRDKKNNDKTYVPREGKAVEINALWYNALCVMKDLAEEFGENDNANKYGELSELVKESMKNFKNTSEGGLYDLIDVKRGDKTVDASIRPNQVIAISLNHSPFDDDKDTMKSVLNVAEEHLLTPMGLRTLSPDDPQYEPYYGDFDYDKRESANHKGTVWPWLIGPYCKAYLKVHGDSIKTHQEVYKLIKPLLNHMNGEAEMKYHAAGGNLLGAISEIADGGKYEEREVNRNDKKIADSPKAKPPLGCEDDSYDDDKACLLKCEDPPAVRLLDKEDPKEKRKTNCYDHMQKGCFTQALSDASVLDIYNRVKDVAEVEETKDGKRKEVKCRSPYIS